VGINLMWLVPGVVGGTEEYTVRLLQAVNAIDPEDLWVKLYCQPELLEAYPELEGWFEVRTGPPLRSKAMRIAAENSWLLAASSEDDLLHHAGSMAPILRGRPYVLTLHDVQALEMPQNFTRAKQRWHAMMLPRAVADAELVLCPSQFSADRASAVLKVPENKTMVVPHGHSEVVIGPPPANVIDELAASYGRYVLYPAISYPHKRHIDLVDALDVLRDRFSDLSIVFTGRPGPEEQNLNERIFELGLSDRVHILGRVSTERLDHLYRGGEAMVFPSEYEGFGNPALEAMARGCPVVATIAGSLPEVVGDAGLLVEPRRPRALAAAVARILNDHDLNDQLRAAGPMRAKDFGWRAAGDALLGAYRSALRGISKW
jgi:glycosyltransferase involved in cell wall biosynthesis